MSGELDISEAKKPKKRQAIIIGINEYEDRSIPKLTGSVNDAMEICQRLRDFGNFEVADKHFLTGKIATCKAIRKAISDLFWQMDPCDLAIFYFSGHGFVDSRGNGYIAPYDMLYDEPLVCGINMAELRHVILGSENKSSVVVILDCCYSGITTKGIKGGESQSFAFEPNFGNLVMEEGGEGKIILASSGETEVSREISDCKHVDDGSPHPHGNFTYHLIEGLDGKAADQTGIITLDGLRRYVEGQLGKQKPKFFAADASQIERIKIAVASKKHNEYIQKKIKEAQDFFNKKHIISVIEAARLISDVLNINKDSKEANELKNKIVEYLSRLKEPIDYWLNGNDGVYVQGHIPDIFEEIQKLPNYLDFTKIITTNSKQKKFFSHLYSVVVVRNLTNEEFIGKCISTDHSFSQASQQKIVLPIK